jgi:hypothetical protein
MRMWGVAITVFYALVLGFLILPAVALFSDVDSYMGALYGLFLEDVAASAYVWLWLALLVIAQALLCLVTIDTSTKRLRPRARTFASVTAITIAVGLLSSAGALSIVAAVWADDALDIGAIVLSPITFWIVWGIVFYLYRASASSQLDRMVGWLIKGSILELLVAVPCHVIVRQRNDCCAPLFTASGLATGMAVMLLAFGPSVLFLYQKRLAAYRHA